MTSHLPSDTPANPDSGVADGISLTPEQTRIIKICLSAIGVLTVGTWTGIASAPYLMSNYPLVLIGISPVSRHMILVAPIVGPWWVLGVGGARTLLFTTVAYFLGRAIGEPGLVWLDQNSKNFSRFVRWLQRFFQRWGYAAIFVFPLGAMASIAGAARIPPVPFFVCATAGIVFRLSLLVLLAHSIREPLMELIELIRAYQLPATLFCIAAVGAYQWWKHRRRRAA